MFCECCPLRASCTKPCADVEELLPQDHTARMVRAYAAKGADFLRALERRHQEVLLMLDYRDRLGGRMRQVFDLKYIDGLTQEQAAHKLHITRRVAGVYLQRAHDRISRLMSAQNHAHGSAA